MATASAVPDQHAGGGDQGGFADDQPNHAAGRGAERDANADLARAPQDHVSVDTVNAHQRQHEAGKTERGEHPGSRAEQPQERAALRERLERRDRQQREPPVERRQLPAQRARKRAVPGNAWRQPDVVVHPRPDPRRERDVDVRASARGRTGSSAPRRRGRRFRRAPATARRRAEPTCTNCPTGLSPDGKRRRAAGSSMIATRLGSRPSASATVNSRPRSTRSPRERK